MLQALNVSCYWNEIPIVTDLSFSVRSGECVHLLGTNGSGKSTVLKVLAGLLPAHRGKVLWQGQSIHHELYNYHDRLAYLGHKIAVKEQLTVSEQLDLCDNNTLKYMGLMSILDVMGEVLSAGQKQRVALARVLSEPSSVLLLDEPFTALDPLGVERVSARIAEYCRQGGLVVMSSHQRVQLDGVPVTTVALEPDVARLV